MVQVKIVIPSCGDSRVLVLCRIAILIRQTPKNNGTDALGGDWEFLSLLASPDWFISRMLLFNDKYI